MIVIDANVAVKWYIPESGTETALELMNGHHQLFAPHLIRLEVLTAITRRVRNGEATEAEARSQCSRWHNHLREGTVTLVPDDDVLEDAVELSYRALHPLLDCMYLATAKRFDAELVTADRKLHNRAKPVYGKITVLAGCESN